METKVCKICGRNLPETDFPMGRYRRADVCAECRTAAVRKNKANKRMAQAGGVKTVPFPTPTLTEKRPERFSTL